MRTSESDAAAQTEQQARTQIVDICRRLEGLELNAGRAGNMAWPGRAAPVTAC
ncbi:MAG: hypothetical protein R3E83_08335 [Burkholderiaceae bacterium]